MWWLFGLGLSSFLPVWRAAGSEKGLSLWQYMAYVSTDEYKESHIPYEEAVEKAQEAFLV